MVLVDVENLPEYVQVIRSNIGPESVENCRDVQNEPIWANFRKIAKGIALGPFIQTPLCFFETENSNFKTLYEYCTLNRLKNIKISFFYILINIKYSICDRISKRQRVALLLNNALWIYRNKR
jgi:hypothetical protein